MAHLLKRYIFWTYERGSLHYDIMVSAILLFLFISPRFIDYKDRPVETIAKHQSEVLVREAGIQGDRARFIYQIRADNLTDTSTDAARRSSIREVVEPISGEVSVLSYEEVKDTTGRTVAYNATVLR